jgi:hypothetical protein
MGVSPVELAAGRPFVLRVELQNRGVCPWTADLDYRLELTGDVKRLGLPDQWKYQGASMVFGDRRVIELSGRTPKRPGEAKVSLSFFAPRQDRGPVITKDVTLRWK